MPLLLDNLDADTPGTSASLLNWNGANGSADVIGAGFVDIYPGNGSYVELDGSSSQAGMIGTTQTFDLLGSVQYRLSFDYARNGSAVEAPTVGIGSFSQRLNLPPGGIVWLTPLPVLFAATGTAQRLTFSAADTDNGARSATA